MKDLIVWSIAAFALSWILADSKISFPFRTRLGRLENLGGIPGGLAVILLTLIECVACSGWHLGWIAQLLGIAPFAEWWLAAFYTCGANLLLAKYVGLLDDAG
jgi:hypothetical protein